MKRLADLAFYIWLSSIFLGLAATVGGCPYTRYIWAGQFVVLWLTIMSAVALYNAGAAKGPQS